MRVAVRHTDKDHPNGGWFAFEQGRSQGFTHPITGESWAPEQVVGALLKRARDQFPEAEGYEHRIETLHVKALSDEGAEIGEWYPVGESQLPRVGQGQLLKQLLETEQVQTEESKGETL